MTKPAKLTRRTALAAGLSLTSVPALAGLAACGPLAAPAEARSDLARVPPGAPGQGPEVIADFSARLAGRLLQADSAGNLIASPLSVLVALAMVGNGAAGETAAEIDATLGFGDTATANQQLNTITQVLASRSEVLDDDREVRVELANSLWGQQDLGFADPFLDALAQYYGAGMKLLDYQAHPDRAVTAINDWTSERTSGLIPEIVTADLVTEETRLVLVNALYFAAPWKEHFEPGLTERRPFTTGSGAQVEAESMSGTVAAWYADDDAEAARIDYRGDQGDGLAMAVVKPRRDVASVLRSWESGGLTRMLSSWQPATVELQLPRFDHDWSGDLITIMQQLGIQLAFTDRADFSAMTPEERLLIEFIQHRATITVDEEGTEAAAATAIGMAPTSAQTLPDRHELYLDRAFLHVVHDVATGTPLFIGVVNDPT